MNKKKKTTIYPDDLIKTIFGENSTFVKELFEKWLEETINRLTPREAKVIMHRYKDGWTLEEIAREYGVTRERIRQIVSRGIRKLQRYERLERFMNEKY